MGRMLALRIVGDMFIEHSPEVRNEQAGRCAGGRGVGGKDVAGFEVHIKWG